MKCLLVFVALVALSAAQLETEDAPSAVAEVSAAASPGSPLEGIATADDSTENENESTSDENTDEPSEGGANPEKVFVVPAPTQPSAPVTTAQPQVNPNLVVVTSSSESPSAIEGRSFGNVAPTLIIPRQPSFVFSPSTAPPPPRPSAFPAFAPSLAPLPAKQPALVEILSRPPPPTPRPNVPYISNVEDRNANVLYYENEINPDGSYKYRFAVDNGIQAEAEGLVVPSNGDRDLFVQAVRGSFGWTPKDGNAPVLITYTADENGYRPVGDAVPTIPPMIARSLAWIEQKRAAERSL